MIFFPINDSRIAIQDVFYLIITDLIRLTIIINNKLTLLIY